MLPKLLIMVPGAWLLLLVIYVIMFWAISKYSVVLIVPSISVSVPVPGCLVFVRLSGVVLVLLSCRVVVVSSCRNVAWFTRMPLMFMYSGRFVVVSR